MDIVLTGATGFLGSALCHELKKNGHNVTAVIRPESSEKAEFPGYEIRRFFPDGPDAAFFRERRVRYHRCTDGWRLRRVRAV